MIPIFQIGLHKRDLALLEQIRSYFGVGHIYMQGSNAVQFIVKSIKELEVVIKHFDKYPLITQKLADYLLFKDAVILMNNKEHLNLQGLEKIINIKASINKGLSDEIKAVFPKSIKVHRPIVENKIIPHSM